MNQRDYPERCLYVSVTDAFLRMRMMIHDFLNAQNAFCKAIVASDMVAGTGVKPALDWSGWQIGLSRPLPPSTPTLESFAGSWANISRNGDYLTWVVTI